MNKPFIVQSYISVEDNTVIKAMYFLGEFSYDIREGLNHQASSLETQSGTFLEQNVESIKKDRAEQPHTEKSPTESSPVTLQKKTQTDISPTIIQIVKEFTLSLADRMRLNLIGIDFLIQNSNHGVRILPIDLNKMPRPEKIGGFRNALLNHCNTKSSYIQLTPHDE